MDRVLCFVIFLIVGYSCQSKEVENQVSNVEYVSNLDGFYIFREGMTLNDVKSVLSKKKLRYSLVDKTKTDHINSHFDWRTFYDSFMLSEIENLKIVDVYDLQILDQKLDKVQIGFFNDTIFYFNYSRLIEFKDDSGFENSEKARQDLKILEEISSGLNEKYGYPQLRNGGLNSFYPTTPPFFESNDGYRYVVNYVEEQAWFTSDTSKSIYLMHFLSEDSLIRSPNSKNLEVLSVIEVLFQSGPADYINEVSHQYIESSVNRTKARSDSVDAVNKGRRTAQIDSL